MPSTKRHKTSIRGEHSDYLTRDEVIAILKIKPQTLYAYVSRGLIHAVPHPNGRSSFYFSEDVERIRVKSAARAGLGALAAGAMHWGEPIIATNITRITEAGPGYRNRLALDLVHANASFEAVADFLWEGALLEKPTGWAAPDTPPPVIVQLSQAAKLHENPHIVQLLILATALLGVSHGSERERSTSGMTEVTLARQAIRTMAGTFGFLGPHRRFVALRQGESVASGIARAFELDPTAAVLRTLNAILVLDVDHELTSSTFAARIAASVGADLHACLGSALNIHHSNVTGSRADRVEELFGVRPSTAEIISQVERMGASAQRVPGFNHPFYPNGDPRAAMLVSLARDLGKRKRNVRAMLDTTDHLLSMFGLRPSFELGAVAVCRALGLPPRCASGFRSLARTAGWVAHIFEQRLAAFMIRPRAKYVGLSTRNNGARQK